MTDTQSHFNFTWDKTTRRERLATMRRIVEEHAGLTTRMIAHRMGLKKTPYVRQMLIELENQGLIHYDWQEMTNGARVMVWFAGPAPMFDDKDEQDEWSSQNMGNAQPESGFPYVTIEQGDLDDIDRIINGEKPSDHPDWPLPSDYLPF